LFFIDKCALLPICTLAHLFIAYFSKEQKSVMCKWAIAQPCPEKKRERGKKRKNLKK